MKKFALTVLSLTSLCFVVLIAGCTRSSAVMLDGNRYEPSYSTEILFQWPTQRKYKQIALVEADGMLNLPMPRALEAMRLRAQAIGADAVIPVENSSTAQGQSLIYNPYLGGYQTLPGGVRPSIRGVAIKYTEPKKL